MNCLNHHNNKQNFVIVREILLLPLPTIYGKLYFPFILRPKEDEIFECQFCFKTFIELDQLRHHDEEHSSDANLFNSEEHDEPTDPSTSETSMPMAAPTGITIEEHKLEVENEVKSDPVSSILQEFMSYQ